MISQLRAVRARHRSPPTSSVITTRWRRSPHRNCSRYGTRLSPCIENRPRLWPTRLAGRGSDAGFGPRGRRVLSVGQGLRGGRCWGDVAAVWEPCRVEPGGAERVCVAACLVESVGEVVEWLDGGVGEVHVVASCEIAGEVLVTEHDEDGSCGVDCEGHASFDKNVWPCLESPCVRVIWGCVHGEDSLIRGEECDHCLRVVECSFKGMANVGAGASAGSHDLAPLLRLEADGAKPVEERIVGWRVVAVDDHDGLAVGGEGGGLAVICCGGRPGGCRFVLRCPHWQAVSDGFQLRYFSVDLAAQVRQMHSWVVGPAHAEV